LELSFFYFFFFFLPVERFLRNGCQRFFFPKIANEFFVCLSILCSRYVHLMIVMKKKGNFFIFLFLF